MTRTIRSPFRGTFRGLVTVGTVAATVVALAAALPGEAALASAPASAAASAPRGGSFDEVAAVSAFDERGEDASLVLASTTGTAAELSQTAAAQGLREVPGLWTQDSRTFATPLGTDQAVVGETPLNYQGGDGWAPIDDSLVADQGQGFAWRNSADAFTAEFPPDLAAGPVKVSLGDANGSWVSYTLVGAAGSPGVVSGNTVSYPDAVAGVTVSYAITPGGVIETLTLDSAAATGEFDFTLDTSAGVSAAADGGAVDLNGPDGTVLASFAQPSAEDAGHVQAAPGTITLNLDNNSEGGDTLRTSLDRTWLSDPARQFPVTIDPTLSVATLSETSCYLDSGFPTTNNCSVNHSVIGYKPDGYNVRRALAQFDVSSIPASAKVESAQYAFDVDWFGGTGSSVDMQWYRAGHSWTQNATWQNPTAGSATWTGGDPTGSKSALNSDPYFSETIANSATGWQYAYLPRLVQQWVDGEVNNNGMVMRADSESSDELFAFYNSHSTSNQPVLTVTYAARTGDDSIQTYLKKNLTDKSTLGVDPGTGNVLLSSTDMSVAGTGPDSDLNLKHFYNSYDAYLAYSGGTSSANKLGSGWLTDTGRDSTVTLYDFAGGGPAVVIMPGGVNEVFAKTSPSADFNDPDGMNGDLSHDDVAHTTKLVDHKSGLTYDWSGTGGTPDVEHLDTITTPVGQTISLSNGSSNDKVTDTKGRKFDQDLATITGGGTTKFLTDYVDENGSRTVSFGYNTSAQLHSYTDAAGNELDYGYDPTSGMVNEISDPTSGNDTTIGYYTTGQFEGYVHTVTQTTTDCANGTNPVDYITAYVYTTSPSGGPTDTVGSTTVSDPNGLLTTYYWDAQRRVLRSVDADGNKQSNTYNADTGEVSTFTDNVSNISSTVAYAGRMVSAVTEPATSPNTAAGSTVDSRANTDSSDPNYQGPAAIPTETTDAQGNHLYYRVPKTGQPYGGRDEITEVHQYDGSNDVTQYLTYNVTGVTNGTVATIANANGNTTSYSYDANANLQTVTPPSPLGAIGYTEDADNRLHTMTDGNGHTTTYTYDGDDRPLTVTYSDSTYVQYYYDTDGNLTQRHNRDTSTDTMSYDGLNRTTAQTYQGESQSFCYDASNELTSLSNDGGTVAYHYSNGFLDTVTEPGGSGCTSYNTSSSLPPSNSRCITVLMDGDNRPTTIAYPGGVKQVDTYLNSGKLSEVKDKHSITTYGDRVYNYTVSGAEKDLLQDMSDPYAGTGYDTTYTYNGMNRLTAANDVTSTVGTSPSTVDYSFTYDLEGNTTSRTKGSFTNYYAYNNADQLCWSGATNGTGCTSTPTGDTSYSYDSDGNATAASNGFAASYDAANVTTSLNNFRFGTGSATSASYADAGQTLRTSLGSTTYTNSLLGLASSSTGTGGQRIDYTRLPTGQLLSMRVGNVTGYDPTTTTNSYYSMLDQQNSVLVMTDATGNVNTRYVYAPYGFTLDSNGTNATTNQNRWISAYFDTTLDLYHLGARYYSTEPARFLQTDPKHHQYDLTQQNQYTYAGDNPVNRSDANGADWGQVAGALAGAFTIDVGGEILGGSAAVGAEVGIGAGLLTGGIGLAIIGIGVGVSALFSDL